MADSNEDPPSKPGDPGPSGGGGTPGDASASKVLSQPRPIPLQSKVFGSRQPVFGSVALMKSSKTGQPAVKAQVHSQPAAPVQQPPAPVTRSSASPQPTPAPSGAFRGRGGPQKKTPGFLSARAKDRLELKELKRQEGDADRAALALKVVQERRKESELAKQQAATAGGATNNPIHLVEASEMPWIPIKYFNLPPGSVSALSRSDHKRYVAIISNYLTPDSSLRFEFNNIELADFDAKLAAEREKYYGIVRSSFDKKNIYAACPGGQSVLDFIFNRIKSRLATISDKGYGRFLKTIPWKTNTSDMASSRMYARKPVPLADGISAKIVMPDPKRRCVINADAATLGNSFPAESDKKWIRDDERAFQMAFSNFATAAISASALRHLLTNAFPLRQYRRAFPVSVVRRFVNGEPQRVAFIGNPVPINGLAKPDILRSYIKYAVRNTITRKKVEKKEPAPDKIYTTVRPLKRRATTEPAVEAEPSKQPKLSTPPESATASEPNLLDELLGEELPSNPAPQQPGPSTAATGGGDLLDSILSSMDTSAPPPEIMDSTSKVATEKIKSDYSYSLLPIDQTGAVKVLVRTRAAGVDTFRQKLTVVSKVEYLAQCGAEKPFTEEIIWNNMTTLLKASDITANVHVNLPDLNCVQIASTKSNRILETMDDDTKAVLSGRWQRLYEVLNIIGTLEGGEFLLVEDGNDGLQLWSENIEENVPTYGNNSSSLLSSGVSTEGWTRERIEREVGLQTPEAINKQSIPFSSRFNGFLEHLPLVWHIVQGRCPISFLCPKEGYDGGQHHVRGESAPRQGRGRGHARGRGGYDHQPFRGRGRGRGGRFPNHRGGGFRGGPGGRGRGGRGGPNRGGANHPYTDHDANPFESLE